MHGTPRILDDGTIIYPKKGKEPPPCLEGYRRKAEQGPDAWILIPLWRDCDFRQQVLRRREDCNCEMLVNVCGHPLGQNLELTISICESCILWQRS
jgi:hypothetical protein